MSKFEKIYQIIQSNREEILQAWITSVVDTDDKSSIAQEQQDCMELLKFIEQSLLDENIMTQQTKSFKQLEAELISFSKFRAMSDYTPTQTANYILQLKRVITDSSLKYDNQINPSLLLEFNDFIDAIALITFEHYVQTREEVISSQAFALEHDTPIVKITNNILLMPLMGIIDTVRAQKIIEKLLDSIVDSQATIAILDMTAVPTFDTHVADNILKTVAAAKIVGAQVVISGISPNAAMTIAKIGISLSEISTFNTLESSIEYAYSQTHVKISQV